MYNLLKNAGHLSYRRQLLATAKSLYLRFSPTHRPTNTPCFLIERSFSIFSSKQQLYFTSQHFQLFVFCDSTQSCLLLNSNFKLGLAGMELYFVVNFGMVLGFILVTRTAENTLMFQLLLNDVCIAPRNSVSCSAATH